MLRLPAWKWRVGPTIEHSCSGQRILLRAAGPLVENHTADAAQAQPQSRLHGFLRGQPRHAGEDRKAEFALRRLKTKVITCAGQSSDRPSEVLTGGPDLAASLPLVWAMV